MEDNKPCGRSTSYSAAQTANHARILREHLSSCPNVPLSSFAMKCALKALEAVESWSELQELRKNQTYQSSAARSLMEGVNKELKTLEKSYRGLFVKDGVCEESCGTVFPEAAAPSDVNNVSKGSSCDETAGTNREDTVAADVERPKTNHEPGPSESNEGLEQAAGTAFVAEAHQHHHTQQHHTQQHHTQQPQAAVASPSQYARVKSSVPIMEESAIHDKRGNETKHPKTDRCKAFMKPNSLFTSIRLTTSSQIKHHMDDSGKKRARCTLCGVRDSKSKCSDCKVTLCTKKGDEQESCMVVWHKSDVDLVMERRLREERETERRKRRVREKALVKGSRTKKKCKASSSQKCSLPEIGAANQTQISTTSTVPSPLNYMELFSELEQFHDADDTGEIPRSGSRTISDDEWGGVGS